MQTVDIEGLATIHPAGVSLAIGSQILHLAVTEEQPAVFLNQALPLILQGLGADFLALAQGEKGLWRIEAAAGRQQNLPVDLLAESLDADAALIRGDWYVAPLSPRSRSGEMV